MSWQTQGEKDAEKEKKEKETTSKEKKAVKIVVPPSQSALPKKKKEEEEEKKIEDMDPDEVVELIFKEEMDEKAGKKKKKRKLSYSEQQELKKRLTFAGVSVGIGLVIAFIGFAFGGLNVGFKRLDSMALYMLAILVAIGPISFVESSRLNRIKKVEARLADLLRDLGESTHAGLTLAKAIKVAAKGEYGLLTPEIRKMAVQISWGVPATEALEMFADRVNTPLVRRAVVLINEANAAGGDVASVLSAAASDTKEIQLLQNERSMEMTMYVATIFVSFIVFLVVIVMVYSTFFPQMKALQETMAKAAEQSQAGGGGAIQAFNMENADFEGVKLVYVLAMLIQGLGDGMVAGLMQTGSMMNGLKYSFFMVFVVFIVYVAAIM